MGSQKDASASAMIDCCMQNNLIPAYWQTHFNGLRSVLESAIPTPRNKQAAHGAGTDPIVVPEGFSSYILHITAATLLFLDKADEHLA